MYKYVVNFWNLILNLPQKGEFVYFQKLFSFGLFRGFVLSPGFVTYFELFQLGNQKKRDSGIVKYIHSFMHVFF